MRRLLPVGAALFLLACPPGGTGPDGGEDAGTGPEIITPNETGWWRDDVFYEVFVRSFQDGSETGDGVGDLQGLTARLDYLNDGNPETTTDLGVNGIWLMPVFASPSYHGYDVTDYRAVKYDYGTQADLEALIAAAHARGIKILLDLVVNHTSSAHPWFVSAREGPDAPYRNFYVWKDTKPTEAGWKRPFGDFGDVWFHANGDYYYAVYNAGMPDLNWRNPEVEAEFVAIMKHWLALGVDGFRVDAVRYLVESEDAKLTDQPETHQVFQRLRHAIHQEYPDALLVAEAWTGNSKVADYYGFGNEFQLAFSFEIADAIRSSIKKGTRADIHQANAISQSEFVDRGFEAPFLTNHDQVRVMRDLMGTGTTPPPKQARLAAALLMAHPGTPFLYYGEELGMVGGASSRTEDKDKRTPMRWDDTGPQAGFTQDASNWFERDTTRTAPEAVGVDVATQQTDPDSLWSLYRRLIALRQAHPALATGVASRPAIEGTGGPGVFATLRTAGDGSRVLLVINLATTASAGFTLPLSGSVTVLEGAGLMPTPTSQSGALVFDALPPQSFAFFKFD